MSLQTKIAFWTTVGVVAIVLTYVLRDVLMPFVAGLVLAYLLDPLADRLEKIGLNRLGATLVILFTFVALFVAVLVLAVPLFASQAMAFIEKAPAYLQRLQALVITYGGPLLERAGGEEALTDLKKRMGDLAGQGVGIAASFLTSLWSGGQALLSIASLLIITPVVTFYLLLDWDHMVDKVDSWVPLNQRPTVRRIAHDIDQAIAGFLRGQTLVCLILGGIYALGLFLVGLNFGVLIGISAGILSFIPYVGSALGLIVALAVAIAQFWPEWTMIGLVLLVFVVGQFIEGNILAPKLVGETVGLHPVWLMFALLAAGSLFGFLGLLLAVPVAAAIGVVTRYAIGRYLESPLYAGARVQDDVVGPEQSG